MSAVVRLILGIFGIREVTKEDGLIDRAIDSPFARVGYGIVLLVLAVVIYNTIKDLKLFK
jgi:hypothetical protein